MRTGDGIRWVPRSAAVHRDRALAAGYAADDGDELRPVTDPRLAPRDEAIFLLHTAAEVEHALLVQYLYAAFCLGGPAVPRQHAEKVERWRATMLSIAREEMGHLATVQNVLRLLGGAINLEREDYPFRGEFYPFHFRLEPLGKDSLAKYVVAEMPDVEGDEELRRIRRRADRADPGTPNRVGALYRQIIDLVSTLSEAELSPDGRRLGLSSVLWGRGDTSLIVRRPTTVAEALEALEAVAEQGEGLSAPADGASEASHFARLLGIYREFPERDWNPSRPAPVDPTTRHGAAGSEITHPRGRLWAQLSNVRYRMLLTDLGHALHVETMSADHALLAAWTFTEMHHIASIAAILTSLPLRERGRTTTAAPPFELPYSLALPDIEGDRWRLHRDLLAASAGLAGRLADGASPQERAVLDALSAADTTGAAEIEKRLAPAGVDEIQEIRILPPLAVARFGSSPEPMDNYDAVVHDATGFRRLVPAPTLGVDPVTGAIASETIPSGVSFRDQAGRIRPIAPFLEVWARFGDDDSLVPLTAAHLTARGLAPGDLRWQVLAANRKASRRTGSPDDEIHADTGTFSDHEEKTLSAHAANFKPGKSIAFGRVRFIRPTEEFPEIRLRFVPGAGAVYGPAAGDPLTVDDVYDGAKGGWEDHWDGDPAAPLYTFPSGTYQGKLHPQTDRYVSDGYVDDSCDAVVTVELLTGARTLRSAARLCSAVPDFAPDSLHVRTLADDLEQAALGPEVPEQVDANAVADVVRRALETVRLMNTMAMNADQGIGGVQTNATNQAAHESGEFERAFEPVFGQGGAPYFEVLARHVWLAQSWTDGVLPIARNLIRSYDEAGDLSDMTRRTMPALMRGSDRMELTLTRRQIALLRRAAEATQGPTTPEQLMLRLVEFFRSMAPLHQHIAADGNNLSSLFSTPALLLDYLRSENAKGPLAGSQAGRALVVPGDPDASAYVALLRRQDHPMHGPFSQQVPGTDKTGLQIVEDWIAAMDDA